MGTIILSLQTLPWESLNLVPDCQYILYSIQTIEAAHVEHFIVTDLFLLLIQLQNLVWTHCHPSFISYLHSHFGIPNHIFKENEATDALVLFYDFDKAHLSHELLHKN